MSDARSLDDALAEARRLVRLADVRKLVVRLLGGLAFQAQVPSWTPPPDRQGRDIDLATRSRDRRPLEALLAACGYEPDRQYNALHGHKQLYFVDRRTQRPVDVLVDRFEMCHRFEFGDRLLIDPLTLPLADLLLSKLQIVKINRKDLLDIVILVCEHELSDDDAGGISLARVASMTSANWGWWRTLGGNLDRLQSFVRDEWQPEAFAVWARHDPVEQLSAIRAAIDLAPKSVAWRLRAAIGDRAAWYDEPEEVGHGAT